MNGKNCDNWFDDSVEDIDDLQIDEYDITAIPNDWNILTIYSFLESRSVSIPGFQRNYVWDIVRASKLIESLILGLPVPQIFLYETARNKSLVIDGQQRLMSIYYFMKQKFPVMEMRAELRSIFVREGKIPDNILHDDRYFEDFKLKLPSVNKTKPNQFNGLKYETLEDYKTQFELRTVRNIIIKQISPKDDKDSSMFEIFNRLNTGGINLKHQEIRSSIYHSEFYNMLNKANLKSAWRHILNEQEPDVHMRDVEILLRGFAMLIDGMEYAPSMVSFLNGFSKKSQKFDKEKVDFLSNLLDSFFQSCSNLPSDAFTKNRRINVALFESAFAALCGNAFQEHRIPFGSLSVEKLKSLEDDPEFKTAMQEGTTKKSNVENRLKRAKALLGSL